MNIHIQSRDSSEFTAHCPDCNGLGFNPDNRDVFCERCQGKGTVLAPACDVDMCGACNGTGTNGAPRAFDPFHCVKCNGTGYVIKDQPQTPPVAAQ